MKLFSRRVAAEGLISSQIYNENQFYKQFVNDIRSARKQIIIESPFLTSSRYESLRPYLQKAVGRGIVIRINTRHPSDHDPFLASQAWTTIHLARQDGIRVMMYTNKLHRKLAVIDQDISWEGSLNIFLQSDSAEFMRRIQSPQIASQLLHIVTNKKG